MVVSVEGDHLQSTTHASQSAHGQLTQNASQGRECEQGDEEQVG